jgi:hypothetical protein
MQGFSLGLILGIPAGTLFGQRSRRARGWNAGPVGAHEHREAAMAVYQETRYRGLAVLVRS